MKLMILIFDFYIKSLTIIFIIEIYYKNKKLQSLADFK